MCGITGFVRWRADGAFRGRDALERMTRCLAHRGPDGEGFHYDPEAGIALGHRRLSIIDLQGGAQPIAGSDGRSQIVLNGEIYNYRELREELARAGLRFTTRSDTEVILRGYEAWGTGVLDRLDGIFGFAIWDAGARRLLVARDHMGVKPIYWREDEGGLAFASEARALLEGPARADLAALGRYLAFRYVPSPLTLFAGIQRLPPGHLLTADAGGVRVESYLHAAPRLREGARERELVDEFSERLAAAVRRQMVSDVPVGALLSGGLDSAVLVHHMRAVASGPVRTFTVGFADEGADSELPDARETARRLGTEHTEVVIPPADFREQLPQAIAQVEEPISSSSALALSAICREARRHVKVVLAGQGADEPLGGYDRYLGERYSHLVRWVPRLLREHVALPAIRALTRSEKPRRALESLGEPDPAKRFARIYNVFPCARGLVRPELRDAVFAETPESVIERHRAAADALPPVAQLMYVDTRMWLPDDLLLYGDKMSMAHGLELRVPYLDRGLVAFLETVPPPFRIRGRTGKWLLKQAALQWFPREIVHRAKRGFAPPLDAWFRGPMRDWLRDALLGPDARTREWLEPAPVRSLLDEHTEGKADRHRALFALLSLELWARRFLAPVEGAA